MPLLRLQAIDDIDIIELGLDARERLSLLLYSRLGLQIAACTPSYDETRHDIHLKGDH